MVDLEDLKRINEYLKNQVNCNEEIESILKNQVSKLEYI